MAENDFVSVAWRKSSYSGGQSGQCVEVAPLPGLIAVRDSKNPDGLALALVPGAFHGLVQHLRVAE